MGICPAITRAVVPEPATAWLSQGRSDRSVTRAVRWQIRTPEFPHRHGLPRENAGMATNPTGGGPAEVRAEFLRWAIRPIEGGEAFLPAWIRPHRGEQRWAVVAVVLGAIALQLALPDEFVLQPRTAAPVLEAALCLILLAWNPGPLTEHRPWLRRLSLTVIGLLALTNLISTVLLVHVIVNRGVASPVRLLASGAAIWLTNVIVYALWYWEFDRGGPVSRARADRHTPDFLFVQMTDDRLDPQWRARFLDYFYLSCTNATAFSPTDTMPMSRWAKVAMTVQSVISIVTVALVVSRAVNIFPSS